MLCYALGCCNFLFALRNCREVGEAMAAPQVLPEVTYAVRLPTAHPIHENFRVRLFQQMLQGPLDDPDCVANLGELMYQVSHVVSGRYAEAEQPKKSASIPPAQTPSLSAEAIWGRSSPGIAVQNRKACCTGATRWLAQQHQGNLFENPWGGCLQQPCS